MSNSQYPSGSARKRVLLVNDHKVVCRRWEVLISTENDLEICGAAGTVTLALELVKQVHPDVVVTCLSLPGRSGLDLVKEVKSQHPHIPVLVVSMHDE